MHSIPLNPDLHSDRNTPPMVSQTPEMAKLKIHQLNALISEASKNLEDTNSLPMKQAYGQQLSQALFFRKNTMLALIQDIPAEIMVASLPDSTLRRLGPSAQAFLEKETTQEGIITVSVAEDFLTEEEKQIYKLHTPDNNTYSVYFDTPDFTVKTGTTIKLTGTLLEDKIVAKSSDVVVKKIAESRSEIPQGEKKVAVILFDFVNNHQRPFTSAQIKNSIFTDTASVNAFYKENSFNLINLVGKNSSQGDVYDWVTIDMPDYPCRPWQWSDAVKEKLTNAGYDISGYDNYIYAFSPVQRDPTDPQNSCWWGGIGVQQGDTSFWNLRYTSALFIVGHELGHNFGVQHANSYTCLNENNARVSISDDCTINSYKDPFTIMGNMSVHQFDGYRKSILGFWDDSRVRTIAANGTYEVALSPTEFSSQGTKAIRIPRDITTAGTIESYYYLDFRQPFGFDNFPANDPIVKGVSIRLTKIPTHWSPESYLIDTHPETETFMDAALLPGETFWDEAKQIEIKTLQVTANSATLSVTIGGRDCHQNPTVNIIPKNGWANAGETLPYSIEVRNNDTQECGRSTFTVRPTLPGPLWAQVPSEFQLDIDPGQSVAKAVKIMAPAQIAEGMYSITQTGQNTRATNYIGIGTLGFNIVKPPLRAPSGGLGNKPADAKKPEISFAPPFNVSPYTYAPGEKLTITVSAKDDSGIGRITINRWQGGYQTLKVCYGSSSCTVTINTAEAPYPNLYYFTLVAEAIDMSGNGNTVSKSMSIRRGSSPAPR